MVPLIGEDSTRRNQLIRKRIKEYDHKIITEHLQPDLLSNLNNKGNSSRELHSISVDYSEKDLVSKSSLSNSRYNSKFLPGPQSIHDYDKVGSRKYNESSFKKKENNRYMSDPKIEIPPSKMNILLTNPYSIPKEYTPARKDRKYSNISLSQNSSYRCSPQSFYQYFKEKGDLNYGQIRVKADEKYGSVMKGDIKTQTNSFRRVNQNLKNIALGSEFKTQFHQQMRTKMKQSPNISKVTLRQISKRENKIRKNFINKGSSGFVLPQLNSSPSPVFSQKINHDLNTDRGKSKIQIIPMESSQSYSVKSGNERNNPISKAGTISDVLDNHVSEMLYSSNGSRERSSHQENPYNRFINHSPNQSGRKKLRKNVRFSNEIYRKSKL
mmetsp:Transcript_10203/g.9011  ORF Transcript_10203/g.9011 Transcript_10203/m.9011 type:complete len:382 (-) Transcript_10203:25-1170(-)